MIRVQASTTIHSSINEVFQYVTDPTNEPAWHTDVAAAVLPTAGPIGVGSEIAYSFRASGGGGKAVGQVMAFELNAVETIQFSRGPMGLTPTITFRFEPLGETTRFIREVEIEPRRVISLMARLVRRRNASFVENLRRRLETP